MVSSSRILWTLPTLSSSLCSNKTVARYLQTRHRGDAQRYIRVHTNCILTHFETQDITDGRIYDYKELAAKYSLELVAGNWLSMPYSGSATHDMVCRISKCLGEVWPFPLPGINDLEECKPRKDIVDITSRSVVVVIF